MADYIQKDLDLIRMTGKGNAEEPKQSKKVKKKKLEKLKRKSHDEDDTASSSGKEKIKKRSKTLSPKQLVKDIKKMKAKEETKSRKSMGTATKGGLLGKIKISAPKKQKPSTTSKEVLQGSPATEPVVKKVKTTEKVKAVASARSKKSLDPDAVSIEAIRFEEGARIEAVDHGQWYKARIVKIDNSKMDILVHFDGWGPRYDTWFPMTSALIRGPTQLEAKLDLTKYEPGEDVLAKWTDGNFYPATVLSVKETGSCNVMYFDGMKKLLRPNLIKKTSEKEKEAAMKAVEKLLLLPPTAMGSPQSSVSAGSPSSDGRRYKTSANDRGRRSLARGADVPKQKDTTKPARKAVKRRAPRITPDQPSVMPTTTPSAMKNSSDDDTFIAKKARLDKITSNLINKVSPTSKSDEDKVDDKDDTQKKISTIVLGDDAGSDSDSPLVIDEETLQNKPKMKATVKPGTTGTKGPKSVNIRGRGRGRPRLQPRVPSLTIKVPRPKQEMKEMINKSKGNEVTSVIQNEKTRFGPGNDSNDKNRQQAGEALLELSRSSTSTINSSELYVSAEGTHSVESDSKQRLTTTAPQSNQEQPIQDSATVGEPDSSAHLTRTYKTGDIVLAKWADCRSYLAYVLKKEPDDFYKIRYYDGMVKTVKSSFIHPWVGPLPDALKTFKPKSPLGRRQRSKSATFRPGSKKGVKITKRRELVKQRRRTVSSSKTDSLETGRTRRRTDSGDMPTDTINYVPDEKVLAKWTDLKWYPATVVSKTDEDHYQVKYHDDLIRVVRDTWLTPWKPPAPVALTHSSQSPTNTSEPTTTQAALTPSKMDDNKDIAKDLEKPEIGSITESGEVVGLGEQAYRTYEKFNVGDTVLARWTDCRSYPATIKQILDDGKYVVEYYDGMRRNLKPAWLKSWNPSALPPPPRHVFRKVENGALSSENIKASNQAIPMTQLSVKQKLKPGRPPGSTRQPQMPRQVVRGYDAYYARLPAQDILTTDHHKFKCRVHGCTKSFRREEMLRTHHKYYHQQRYKLRDQDPTPAPVKKRTNSKEDSGIRRRVSADYESITKGFGAVATGMPTADGQALRSRGAKPPIDIYKEQHGNVSVSSMSSVLDSSSGADDNKQKLSAVDKAQPTVEAKLPTVSEFKAESKLKKGPGRKSKRTSSLDVTVDAAKHEKALEQPPTESAEAQVTPEPAAAEKDTMAETINEDVIRCTCNSEEEEGFMIQCDGCFTWQHAACVGFDQPEKSKSEELSGKQKKSKSTKEDKISLEAEKTDSSTIVEGYVCWVCKNPKNVRKSMKYIYNNDFIAKGKLPSLSDLSDSSKNVSKPPKRNVLDSMMLSSLLDEVTKMQETLAGMKKKIQIAADPAEHSLLETFKGDAASATQMTSDTKPIEDTNGSQSSTQSVKLENGVPDPNTASEKNTKEQPAMHKTKSKNNGKKKQTSRPDEDRDAYIRQCRENLLDHILSLEAELNNRITRINDFITSIDSGIDDVDEIKGVESLQDDLTAVQKLLSYC